VGCSCGYLVGLNEFPQSSSEEVEEEREEEERESLCVCFLMSLTGISPQHSGNFLGTFWQHCSDIRHEGVGSVVILPADKKTNQDEIVTAGGNPEGNPR